MTLHDVRPTPWWDSPFDSHLVRTASVLATLFLVIGATSSAVAAQEAGDHPLVGHYEGSEVMASRTSEFDEYLLPLGPLEDGEFGETRRVEGKITWVGYRNPDGRSALEVFRNHEEQLASEGFETLFACEGVDTCGYWFADRIFEEDAERYLHAGDTGADEGIRYLAARREDRGQGDVYAQVTVYDDGNDVWTRVRVIEERPRETGKVVVSADEIAESVAAEGRVVLEGLYFDTDEATIRPDSEPQLEAIGDFLDARLEVKVFVVGHTDMAGTLAYNLDLSRRRAEAVVRTLIEDFGIDPARLTARGVGPLAPSATNRTEEGRALNRRVVLVARSGTS